MVHIFQSKWNWAALAAAVLLAAPSWAQEPIHGESAVSPSAGHLLLRQQFRFARYGEDPSEFESEVDEWTSWTRLQLGLTQRLSLSVDVPLVYREAAYEPPPGLVPLPGSDIPGHDHGGGLDFGGGAARLYDFGLADVPVLVKYRFFQKDLGPVDTVRASVFGGVEVPSGDEAFSSDSWDPIVGAAVTAVLGRHGGNLDVRYQFNSEGHREPIHPGSTGEDMLGYDVAYLFRLAPGAFSGRSRSALYFLIEASGQYEANGDHELMAGPGLMYEASKFALELSVMLPLYESVDERQETEFMVTVGLRWLF